MHHEPGALHGAAHRQEARRHHRAAVLREDFRPDDDVGDVGLVLERHEDDAVGGARLLADEHEPGDGDHLVLAQAFVAQLRIAPRAKAREAVAEEADGVRLERQAGRQIILRHVLAECHRRQRDLGLGEKLAAEMRREEREEARVGRRLLLLLFRRFLDFPDRRPLHSDGVEPARRPQRGAAVEPDRAERVGLGEALDGKARDAGHRGKPLD